MRRWESSACGRWFVSRLRSNAVAQLRGSHGIKDGGPKMRLTGAKHNASRYPVSCSATLASRSGAVAPRDAQHDGYGVDPIRADPNSHDGWHPTERAHEDRTLASGHARDDDPPGVATDVRHPGLHAAREVGPARVRVGGHRSRARIDQEGARPG